MIKSLINFLSKNPYLLPALFGGLTLLMLLLTLLPFNVLGSSPIFSYDKFGHLILFASWTFLLGLYLYTSNSFQLNLFTIFFTGVSFGVIIEVLQYMLPYQRSADLFDIAFDSIGCLIGVLALKKTISDSE